MAKLNETLLTMSMPKAMRRGNPIPLDSTAVWYDWDALTAYATSGATAYVGQVLSYVAADGNVKVYSIIDTAGTLQEVGSATMGDDASIVLTNSTLSLKNWGIQYYRWVDGEGGAAGRYELQAVDDTHPWRAGLEPKVALADNGALELAWYEPNPITVEGLSSAIGSVQTNLTTLSGIVGTSSDPAGSDTVFGQLNEKITAAQAETLIAETVASAGHLRREIVETLPEASAADPDVIYMVKDAFAIGDDKYKEYMLIGGELTQIGDTSVDLSGYVQKKSGVAENVIGIFDASGDIVGNAAGKTLLDFVEKEDGKRLMTEEEGAKLAGLVGLNDATFAAPLTFNADTKTLSVNEATADAAGLMSAELFSKLTGIEAGAQANTVEGALLAGLAATIDENKNIVIPAATAGTAGLVKASDEIAVAENGAMSLSKVNAMKIYVDDVDELILSGGNAAE